MRFSCLPEGGSRADIYGLVRSQRADFLCNACRLFPFVRLGLFFICSAILGLAPQAALGHPFGATPEA